MQLSFHGADRSVTGSCHMVECAGERILIDCGPHQGRRASKLNLRDALCGARSNRE
jgi:Cft2 family RNA processing exonuclease